ncbi:MAG TPA: dephospho-CoA kinase, long form [Candidatus Microbacterium stercoravium]|uniref:Dephospho-CoA kinase n=1 Tax=Candidatus Microbacterium stercoravium TaxID=2838697 RepID=A0A9D2KG70_9MICO|nr:dephospho-CoA kinase, long form [Candidatus Microbacterium stercoravium]
MPLIALTGGIASGKSTIARRLASHGVVVVDADQTVRDLQRPGEPVFDEIVREFGDGVVAADGALDRAALGSIVFGDAERLAALNAIVHPAVRAETERRFREAGDRVVVYDVPLLAEARGAREWDLIVVAHAPAEMRAERMMTERGMSLEDATARIAHQASDEERLEMADVVIDTSGTIEHTLEQADALWERIHG